jgi:hypothetical protein
MREVGCDRHQEPVGFPPRRVRGQGQHALERPAPRNDVAILRAQLQRENTRCLGKFLEDRR